MTEQLTPEIQQGIEKGGATPKVFSDQQEYMAWAEGWLYDITKDRLLLDGIIRPNAAMRKRGEE